MIYKKFRFLFDVIIVKYFVFCLVLWNVYWVFGSKLLNMGKLSEVVIVIVKGLEVLGFVIIVFVF